MEAGARIELATFVNLPDAVLAGAVMMRKLEHNNDDERNDKNDEEAVLYAQCIRLSVRTDSRWC